MPVPIQSVSKSEKSHSGRYTEIEIVYNNNTDYRLIAKNLQLFHQLFIGHY